MTTSEEQSKSKFSVPLTKTQMPSGKHAAVTWSIPDTYGGMTKALLHRSAAMVQLGDICVDIITFDWRSCYDEVRRTLSNRGELVDGLSLVNFWEEISSITDDKLERLVGGSSEPFASELPESEKRITSPERLEMQKRESKSDTAADLYYRPDGTLFLANETKAESGVAVRRAVRVHRRDGSVIDGWDSMKQAYFAWLDSWSDGEQAYLIVDSKYVANFMHEYKRDEVVTAYMIHGSHLQGTPTSPYGPILKSRSRAMRNMHSFDAICALTSYQRGHVASRFGDIGNLRVVPNGYTPPVRASVKDGRDSRRGVVVARLAKGKRIDHAIEAVADGRQLLPEGANLQIYGTGDQEDTLNQLVSKLEVQDIVSMEGYTADPYSAFASASYSLLTSTSEGFSLVILESMSAGCIPIVYDVPYGPSELIEHGVTGFLVEPGNVASLRDSILAFLTMPADEVSEMRAAAMARVGQYSDSFVTERWSDILTSAMLAKRHWRKVPTFSVEKSTFTFRWDGDIEIGCRVTSHHDIRGLGTTIPLYISLYDRHEGVHFRRQVNGVISGEEGLRISAVVPAASFENSVSGVLDICLEAVGGGRVFRRRLPYVQAGVAPSVYSTVYGNLSARV